MGCLTLTLECGVGSSEGGGNCVIGKCGKPKKLKKHQFSVFFNSKKDSMLGELGRIEIREVGIYFYSLFF